MLLLSGSNVTAANENAFVPIVAKVICSVQATLKKGIGFSAFILFRDRQGKTSHFFHHQKRFSEKGCQQQYQQNTLYAYVMLLLSRSKVIAANENAFVPIVAKVVCSVQATLKKE